MPRKHKRGELAVPTFHADGSGRDLYQDTRSTDALRKEPMQPLQYTDIETGEKCYLRWWTRLPASGEFKSRLKTQKAMAIRLTQLPSLEKTLAKHGRSQSAIPFGTGLDRYNKMALEHYNPWSPHQSALRNYALTYGMQKKPDRFSKSCILAAGGFTDVRM